MTKTCNSCNETRSLKDFSKNGKTVRGTCKPCSNAKAKENYTSRSRGAAPEYVSMSESTRHQTYKAVILRMADHGIMSDSYAKDALERIKNLERAK